MIKISQITTALIISGLLLWGCSNPTPKSSKYTGSCVANPIIYEVIVNNPNPDDEWKHECLGHTDINKMVSDIVERVITQKLKAYDYYDNHILSTKELNQLMEDGFQKRIGKLQFTERWYWDAKQLKLQKKVERIMLGYEIYDDKGEVKGYKAGFMVILDQRSNKQITPKDK